jgi:GAF domain-containing protein
VRGAVIGAIGVYDDPRHPLPPEDLALIEAVSEQVALALESARLFEQTQRDADRERTISAISERIYSTSDVKQLMQITAEELRRATGSARAIVRLNFGTGGIAEKPAQPDEQSETSKGRTTR